MAITVRAFIYQMYRLINASNPVVPLHGDDESLALQVMNQIFLSYASSGLMLTIAQTVQAPINIGIKYIYFVDPDYPLYSTQTEIVTLTFGLPTFNVLDGTIYSVGDKLSGNGITVGTVITQIVGNVITMSSNSTFSGLATVTFSMYIGDPSVVYILSGRLANLDNAWLLLSGVTYPLIDKSRDEYLSAWKYEPLQGLPRFIITFPGNNFVSAQLYPAPSQFFTFMARGKFQLVPLTINDDMSNVPDYYQLYFLYAVAKMVAYFKGRASAWTPELEAMYRELKDNMEAASEINLSISGDEQSLLNGAYRVRAGI